MTQETKHVHHDVIIAWAKGETIEFRNQFGTWRIATTTPTFDEHWEYRVKPEPLVVYAKFSAYVRASNEHNGIPYVLPKMFKDNYFDGMYQTQQDDSNLRLEICPTSGDLLKIELI